MLFTQHIKKLPVGDCPPELLDAIAIALRAEMRKRRLWTAPPAWLGYDNWNRWDENISKYKENALKRYPDAFIDLILDCCEYAIIKRFSGLRAALKQSDNIDGLVLRNITHFLNELQRKCDPVGSAIFTYVKGALQCAIDSGILKCSNNDKKIHNETLLIFSSFYSSTHSDKEQILEVLRHNRRWKDIRLKLAAAGNQDVQQPLYEIICQLVDSNIQCFWFKSLVDAIKEEVRVPSASVISNNDEILTDGALIENEYLIEQSIELTPEEIYQNLGDFCAKLRDAIDNSKRQFRVRQLLHKILIEREIAIKQQITLPSPEEVARRLGVSVNTFNQAKTSSSSLENMALQLSIAVGTLNDAIKTSQKVRLPSQEELAKRLNVSAGIINKDIKILREELAPPIKKVNDWDATTLSLIEKMLK